MPRYGLRKCARCGSIAAMLHDYSMRNGWSYWVECTKHPTHNMAQRYGLARKAAKEWNAVQKDYMRVKEAPRNG